jgi:23S rRNA pseudouridine1911/1915/1917 synthase
MHRRFRFLVHSRARQRLATLVWDADPKTKPKRRCIAALQKRIRALLMLNVLYEDNHCLAVDKPPGLSTQAPPGVPSLELEVRAYLKEKCHKPGNVYLGVPHRIDRPVSGVVLFARQTVSAQRLAEQFRNRQVRKVYWALVEPPALGEGPPEQGTWEDWLVKVPQHARSQRVEPGTAGAKQALLRFRRLLTCDAGTLLEIEPQTGRMHQIRIQAASRGWPVRGDELYGARLQFGPLAIGLHAQTLVFLHPVRFEPVTVTAPLPRLWQAHLPPPLAGEFTGEVE